MIRRENRVNWLNGRGYAGRWFAALAAALIGLGVAGCGGDSDIQSKEPLKIGAVFDFSGELSTFGPRIKNAADLSVTMVNQGGGVLGRPLEVVFRDGGADAKKSAEAALDLVDTEGVEVIIGPISSGATMEVARTATIPRRILHISPGATSPVFTTLADDDFFFRARVSEAAHGIVLARLAREEGHETAAAIYINNPYGQELARIFRESFEQAGGRVTALVPQEPGQSSYAAELTQAVADSPDVLVAMSYPESLEVYLNEALEDNYIDSFLFATPAKSQALFDKLGGARFEGTYGTDVGSPINASNLAFQAMYTREYGENVSGPLIAETFDAITLVALAIEQAGEYDGPKVRDALRTVSNPPGIKVGPQDVAEALKLVREGKDVDYEGVNGPLNFDENGDVLNTIEIWQIRGGVITATGRYETP